MSAPGDSVAVDGDTSGVAEVNELTRAVLAEVSCKGQMPSVARFMNEVLSATRTASTPTYQIVDLVLKDLSLTSSILRLVNSAYYRRGSDKPISTVSRAIVLLGVDAVVNIALGLNVFEHFGDRSDLHHVKRLMVRSLLTAVHAAEISRSQQLEHPEEAFIGGLLHDLGRVALTFYVPDRREAIERLVTESRVPELEAWRRTVGVSPHELGELVAREWRLPDVVTQVIGTSTVQGPDGVPDTPLGAIVAFGRALADATMAGDEATKTAAIQAAAARFGDRIPLTPRQLDHVLASSTGRLRDLSTAFRISRADLERAVPLLAQPAFDPAGEGLVPPLATAEERQQAFLRFMEEIALALTRRCPLNDLFLMILEGMYRGVGGAQVVLALLTPDRSRLRARFALGVDTAEVLAGFDVPIAGVSGPLAEVVTARRTLHHTDSTPVSGVSEDFLRLLGTATWMMLPIEIGSPSIGAFFIGRTAAEGPFTPAEQRSLRTLANYAVLAVRQSSGT